MRYEHLTMRQCSMVVTALVALLGACRGEQARPAAHAVATPVTAAAPRDDRSALVGMWSTSTGSYESAAAETEAVRLAADGVMTS